MIYISTTIEPKDAEEFPVLSVSLVRKEEKNEKGESKYTYGGWWKDKNREQHYFTNDIYVDRNVSIMELSGRVCLEIAVRETS
jgi:hypothetical protein